MSAIIIVALVLACLIGFWLSKKEKSISKEKKRESDTPKLDITLNTVSVVNSNKPISEHRDSSVILTHDGGWLLNPESTFPLTLYGIDQQTAEEIKKRLDTPGKKNSIVSLIDHPNFCCKEVEDYVRKFKPQYLRKIGELKRFSKKWSSASEGEQEDLLISFREQAIESLDIRTSLCDLEFLFEYDRNDATIDKRLIDRFGYENIHIYLHYLHLQNAVVIIPSDHHHRSSFETLVEVGLTIKGSDIPLQVILNSDLPLREMNEMVAVFNQKPFGRKIKAIDFLLKVPDAKEKLSDLLAVKGFFQVKPLPDEFSNIDINKFSEAWRYPIEIGRLIAHTYRAGHYAARNMHQNQADLSIIKNWNLLTCDDDETCPLCKRAAKKSYSKNQYPNVPLHIGCRCTVIANVKDNL